MANNSSDTSHTLPINLTVRMKNPWFWVGVIGVVSTALNFSPEAITTWEDLFNAVILAFQNPYTVMSAFTALLGVFVDPTTSGIEDSTRALAYTSPKR